MISGGSQNSKIYSNHSGKKNVNRTKYQMLKETDTRRMIYLTGQ